jgi:hypothetical protein
MKELRIVVGPNVYLEDQPDSYETTCPECQKPMWFTPNKEKLVKKLDRLKLPYLILCWTCLKVQAEEGWVCGRFCSNRLCGVVMKALKNALDSIRVSCNSCGKKHPLKDIKVRLIDMNIDQPSSGTYHFKYCPDDPECLKAAYDTHFVNGELKKEI